MQTGLYTKGQTDIQLRQGTFRILSTIIPLTSDHTPGLRYRYRDDMGIQWRRIFECRKSFGSDAICQGHRQEASLLSRSTVEKSFGHGK